MGHRILGDQRDVNVVGLGQNFGTVGFVLALLGIGVNQGESFLDFEC